MTWISSDGIDALSAVRAGSSQRLMVPLKILASVGPSSTKESAVLRLYVMASGPNTTGRFQASAPPHRFLAAAYWSPVNGMSDPAKSVLPARKSLTPAPEPFAV